MTPTSSAAAEQQRLEQQQWYIDLAISGRRRRRPSSAGVPGTNGPLVPSVAERQVILTAHKRDKRFESAVSVSVRSETIRQMERYGWTVVVGEEHDAPATRGRR